MCTFCFFNFKTQPIFLTTNLLIFAEGRKKTKDGKDSKKKRSGNSSEEDSAGTVRGSKKKKMKGSNAGGNAGGTTSGGAISASGEGSYRSSFILSSDNEISSQMITVF